MEASWSDRGTVTLANKLISPKDSAWITVLIKRSADPRLETHCGKMKITVDFEECLKDSPRFR